MSLDELLIYLPNSGQIRQEVEYSDTLPRELSLLRHKPRCRTAHSLFYHRSPLCRMYIKLLPLSLTSCSVDIQLKYVYGIKY